MFLQLPNNRKTVSLEASQEAKVEVLIFTVHCFKLNVIF